MSEPNRADFLQIRDVDKSYGAKRILDNVDLEVERGELCSVVGPSGCGKSTLLRLILGQESPTAGQILVDGVSVDVPCPDRGVVYQRYSLFPHLSALENVLLGRTLTLSFAERRRRRIELHDEALAFLEKVGLGDHAGKYPHQLSGGQQQRVAVVQSLLMRPKILLMDEPFGALDPGTREDLQLFLLDLWEETQMTIFFVTHDLEEAVFVGSRLLVLSQYYSDDRGEHGQVRRGAKIVADHSVKADQQAFGTREKYTGRFIELIEEVRLAGFDPGYRQHARDFDLRHPHSMQTLRQDEDGQLGDDGGGG